MKHLSGNSEWILHTFWKFHNDNSWYKILLKFSNYESCNENIVKSKSKEILLTLEGIYVALDFFRYLVYRKGEVQHYLPLCLTLLTYKVGHRG